MTTEQRLQQLEDRIAIRELIDAYTYCADTRNIQGIWRYLPRIRILKCISMKRTRPQPR
jgi:hypothetical protein